MKPAARLLVATLSFAASAGFAAGAGVIPINGAFGNEAGCLFFAIGRSFPEMLLLTPDTFTGGDIGCDFESATTASGVFSVRGVCSIKGKPPLVGDILEVRSAAPGYLVDIDGRDPIGPLLPCVTMLEGGVPA